MRRISPAASFESRGARHLSTQGTFPAAGPRQRDATNSKGRRSSGSDLIRQPNFVSNFRGTGVLLASRPIFRERQCGGNRRALDGLAAHLVAAGVGALFTTGDGRFSSAAVPTLTWVVAITGGAEVRVAHAMAPKMPINSINLAGIFAFRACQLGLQKTSRFRPSEPDLTCSLAAVNNPNSDGHISRQKSCNNQDPTRPKMRDTKS